MVRNRTIHVLDEPAASNGRSVGSRVLYGPGANRPFAALGLLLFLASAAFAADPPPNPDIATVKQRLVASVLPTQPTDRDALAKAVAKTILTLRPDGSWPDIDYTDRSRSEWKASVHLQRLLQMAKAYQTPDQSLFHNADLRAQTFRALDYWLDRDFQNPNWWWNQIGGPQLIGETMILMDADLTAAERAKGDTILRHAPLSGTGANLVWLAGNNALRGLLENDPAVVGAAFSRMFAEVKVVTPDQEGIQADRSFHQHGRQLYSGGYGYFYGDDLARYTAYTWNTRFQIPPDRLTLLLSYLLDGQRAMVYSSIFDYSAIGREITRANLVAAPTDWSVGPISPVGAAYGLPHAVELLAACPDIPRRGELQIFAQAIAPSSNVILFGRYIVPLPSGNYAFWDSDYLTHRRDRYLATLRMCSNRMQNSEITNNEGRRSQHLGDGVTYIYQSGDEYRDIFAVWDWQRIPGTTAIQRAIDPFPASQVGIKGATAFVGSVSDGVYGLAAFDFARGPLTARKAWFYEDDGFVCLGAGITDTSPTGTDPTLTSINQCLLHGPVRYGSTEQAGSELPPGSRDLHATRWVWHDGIGYAFPFPTTVHVANQPQTGRWSDSGTGSDAPVTHKVFSLALDHGVHPTGATYAYKVLPGCPLPEIDKRSAETRIVANTPDLQAVRTASLGLLQAAFYAPGTLDAKTDDGGPVTVDQPCLLQYRRDSKGVIHLAVSNPKNLPLTVTITLDGAFTGPGCAPAGVGKTAVRVDLPTGERAGSSVVVTLLPH